MSFLRATRVVGNLLLGAALVIVSVYPLLWLLAVSLQDDRSAYQTPTRWVFLPRLGNYIKLLTDPAFLASLANSVQIAAISTALCVVMGAMAGFALSRFRVRGAVPLTVGLAISRFLPTFAIVIPTFYIFRKLGLLDTMPGLILALVAFQVPLSTLIMWRVFNGIPPSIDEAAKVDGAGTMRTFWNVILPIARPGLASSAVVTFVLIWNEFLFILVLAGNEIVTIPMTIATFQADKQILWGSIAASSIISMIPIVILVLVAHRHLLAGLGAGAVKE